MDIDAGQWKFALLIFTLSLPRILAAFTVLPFMSKQVLGGAMIRNGIVFSLALFLFPVIEQGISSEQWTALQIVGIIIKEVIIGMFVGFLSAIPFWAIEAVGSFIDNQRGATMASTLNPLSGSQVSPLSILFVQALTTLFFVSGIFLFFLGSLYASYKMWPVFSFYPQFSQAGPLFFLGQLDALMRFAVLLGAPIIIAMFLAEFGLALVSRFAPQLNVFFLSMPIKSAVANAMLLAYMAILLGFFSDHLRQMDSIFTHLNGLFR